jgi:hypothetical protein
MDGYTMMCEQPDSEEMVRDAQMAEEAGVDFGVIYDRYFP